MGWGGGKGTGKEGESTPQDPQLSFKPKKKGEVST